MFPPPRPLPGQPRRRERIGKDTVVMFRVVEIQELPPPTGEGGPACLAYNSRMSEYARHEHHDFLGAARQALADPPLQAALVRLTGTLLAGNRRGYAALADSGPLRDHAKRIKEHTLAHLDRYLEQLEASVHKLGGHVHRAATAEDARRTVVDIARRAGCTRA